MNRSDKIQLVVSSVLVVTAVLSMISMGNTDIMFFYWLPHLWWVIIMTKFLTCRFPDKQKFVWAALTVIIGFSLYFGSLFIVIPWILRSLGVDVYE